MTMAGLRKFLVLKVMDNPRPLLYNGKKPFGEALKNRFPARPRNRETEGGSAVAEPKYRLLIVEDDPAITGVLERHLTKWGYLTEHVTEFDKVLEQFQKIRPHLVLLDISLPFFNGYHWCGEIRKISRAPILFLSSAGDDLNQVMALSMGADDFIPKPFSLEVATAKIQALLRRAYSFGGDPDCLTHGGVTLNLGDATLSYGESAVELTKNEFKILQTLLEQPGAAVSRETLMERLWQTDCFIDDNTLTVNMTRLRKKLEAIGLCGFIVTKKGIGYQIP